MASLLREATPEVHAMDANRAEPDITPAEGHQHQSDPFEPHERAALADAEAAAPAADEEALDDLEEDLDDADVDADDDADDDDNLDVEDEIDS
jgi:hypothetical protein